MSGCELKAQRLALHNTCDKTNGIPVTKVNQKTGSQMSGCELKAQRLALHNTCDKTNGIPVTKVNQKTGSQMSGCELKAQRLALFHYKHYTHAQTIWSNQFRYIVS
ncbi:hypothetical protein BgiMline_028588 [Biomphalaria glabrata]|nr:hypothetical protein BgiMline_014383 [Biomphalaria glabrata]